MKVMTVLGTRPEIIRLSQVIPKLDECCEHVLIHTEQNFDQNLSDIFFDQMKVRKPDYHLGAFGTLGQQVGKILVEVETLIKNEKPDKFLVLGDTNSALSVIAAKRAGVPVYHMEAGNRCYDDRVPEEVNRRIIDHCSDILMPYTGRSRQNLIREGIQGENIFVTGNPIYEVIQEYKQNILRSQILTDLELEAGKYFLVTMHRAENVDVEERIKGLTESLDMIQRDYDLPIIVSTHPHTRNRIKDFGIDTGDEHIRFLPPFGFFDFITLEQNAFCVLSDSGTVQEECAIFGIPNVTIRDVTERPETIECGSNILSGADPESVLNCVRTVLNLKSKWVPPGEYIVENVSSIVIKIMLGYRNSRF
jgi:UDP-N-acetylglucosamine 2-epimerase (non-hydrolysing)